MDPPALTARARRAGLALACLLVAALFAGRVWLIPAHFSTDPNEGWNAIQAARAMGAGPLYPPPGGLIGNNYPPLSFYLIGWLARAGADAIVAGRIVALLSVFAVAAAIGLLVRRLAPHPRWTAPAAALLFLGFAATLLRPYLAMDDPQWAAHALMTAGLWLLVPEEGASRPSTARTVAAALLILAGSLVKHNLVAVPIAVTLWLLWHHRPVAGVWIGTGLAGLALAALLCGSAYGADFFADLLAAPRHYSAARMLDQGWPLAAIAPPMLLAALPLLRLRRTDARADLLLILAAVAVPIGIVQQSGQGVDVNADVEAVIALALAGAVALAEPGWRIARLLLLAAPLAALLPGASRDERGEFADRRGQETAWAAIERRIAAEPGLVACAMPAYCYWAGRGMGIDVFLYGQHMIVRHDATALERALAERRFALIELEPDDPPIAGERPDPIAPLVTRHTRTVFRDEDGARLMRPRWSPTR